MASSSKCAPMYRSDISIAMLADVRSDVKEGVRPRARLAGTLSAMTFRADLVRGAGSNGVPGQVDYRLARQHVVAEFRRGRLSRLDVCDAHPELLRNARELGEPISQSCPICDDEQLV